jgi:hypothetical protein
MIVVKILKPILTWKYLFGPFEFCLLAQRAFYEKRIMHFLESQGTLFLLACVYQLILYTL